MKLLKLHFKCNFLSFYRKCLLVYIPTYQLFSILVIYLPEINLLIMKSKIPILLFIAGCMVHAPLHAEEPRMVVNTFQGDPVEIELSTATRITFSEDLSTMTVKGEDDDVSIDIDDISNIMFTIDSSVDNVVKDLDGLKISSRGYIVTISGAGQIEYLAVDMSGSPQFAGQSRDNVTLDFSTRPAGVYIIRANNTTFKFIK